MRERLVFTLEQEALVHRELSPRLARPVPLEPEAHERWRRDIECQLDAVGIETHVEFNRETNCIEFFERKHTPMQTEEETPEASPSPEPPERPKFRLEPKTIFAVLADGALEGQASVTILVNGEVFAMGRGKIESIASEPRGPLEDISFQLHSEGGQIGVQARRPAREMTDAERRLYRWAR